MAADDFERHNGTRLERPVDIPKTGSSVSRAAIERSGIRDGISESGGSQSELSAEGESLLNDIFGDVEALHLDSGDFDCLASLLYDLRYHKVALGRRKMDRDQFKFRVIARLHGYKIKDIAEMAQAAAPGVSVFFKRMVAAISQDSDLTQLDRQQLIVEMLAADRETRGDRGVIGLDSFTKFNSAKIFDEEGAVLTDGMILDGLDTYNDAQYAGLSGKISRLARMHGRPDLVDFLIEDDELLDISRRVIKRHNPSLDPYDYVNRYFSGSLSWKHPVDRHIMQNLAHWILQDLEAEY